jgi:hypothetical protein
MGFVWSGLAIGDTITYAHGAGIDELRDNCDSIHASVANVTYNGTVHAGDDSSVRSGHDSSVNGSNYSNFSNNADNSLQGYK